MDKISKNKKNQIAGSASAMFYGSRPVQTDDTEYRRITILNLTNKLYSNIEKKDDYYFFKFKIYNKQINTFDVKLKPE